MVVVIYRSVAYLGSAINHIALVERMVVSLALMLSVLLLLTSQAFGQDDVGLPMHPKAIPSTIVRQSGEGEGTRWVQVNFTINAPYEQVVKFYRKQVGRNVQISQIDSGTHLNTLILFSGDPTDQLNISISSELGRKVTEVEPSRNVVRP